MTQLDYVHNPLYLCCVKEGLLPPAILCPLIMIPLVCCWLDISLAENDQVKAIVSSSLTLMSLYLTCGDRSFRVAEREAQSHGWNIRRNSTCADYCFNPFFPGLKYSFSMEHNTIYKSLTQCMHTLEDAICSSKGIASKHSASVVPSVSHSGVHMVSSYWVVWHVVGPEDTTGMNLLPDLLLCNWFLITCCAVWDPFHVDQTFWTSHAKNSGWAHKDSKSSPYEEYTIHFCENSSVTPDVGRITTNSSCYQGFNFHKESPDAGKSLTAPDKLTLICGSPM